MRQVQEKVYSYKELCPVAKNRALYNYRKHIDSDDLKNELMAELKGLLELCGLRQLRPIEIFYSLSHCQGDGLCFIGSFEFNNYEVLVEHHNNHYCHSNSVTITITDKDACNDAPEKTYDEFKTTYEKLCSHLEKRGYEIIDQEDESNLEGLEFYEDGGRYYG
jgi:hypothetical protein